MVVDDYEPVVEAIDREIDDVERAVFARQEDLTTTCAASRTSWSPSATS